MTGKLWYPVFLDMDGRRAVVIGAGKVALRKVRGLLEAGASVTVISPRFDSEFDGLAIERIEREFEDADVDGAHLLFAATNVREVNRRVGEMARSRGVPANIADARAECGFIVPARILRDQIQIAISTGGQDPKLAAGVRRRVEECLDSSMP
jgi:siroheme synthase-like protein